MSCKMLDVITERRFAGVNPCPNSNSRGSHGVFEVFEKNFSVAEYKPFITQQTSYLAYVVDAIRELM